MRLVSGFASDGVKSCVCFLWLTFGLAATKLALGVAGRGSSMRANAAEDTSLRLAASLLRGGMAGEKARAVAGVAVRTKYCLLSRAIVELGIEDKCARQ